MDDNCVVLSMKTVQMKKNLLTTLQDRSNFQIQLFDCALTASTKTTPATTTTTKTASSESSEPNKIEPENKRVMRNSLRKTTKTLLNDKMTKEKETSINSFKNLNTFHPRIKYSKHKNPSIHQQQQQQQSSKTTSSSSISSSSVVSSIITTTSNTTDINQQTKINLKQHQQQQQHFHELEITSGASSNADNDEDDLHSSIMTDLANYAEIDDIELPDGSKIGFGDTDEFTNDGVDEQKYSSASLDDDYKLMSTTSSSSMKYEYLSDSAVSATDELGRHYICRHCGKRYRWKSTLRRHENVECGGKQPMHQCPHCTYKAKQRGNLGVHIRKHHTAMPPLESRRKLNLNRSN